MPDRVVIVAPTEAEASGEADELGIPRAQQHTVHNGSPYSLRGMRLTESELVRVRESGWSDELRSLVDAALIGGEL
jgi:hypothetical protein